MNIFIPMYVVGWKLTYSLNVSCPSHVFELSTIKTFKLFCRESTVSQKTFIPSRSPAGSHQTVVLNKCFCVALSDFCILLRYRSILLVLLTPGLCGWKSSSVLLANIVNALCCKISISPLLLVKCFHYHYLWCYWAFFFIRSMSSTWHTFLLLLGVFSHQFCDSWSTLHRACWFVRRAST